MRGLLRVSIGSSAARCITFLRVVLKKWSACLKPPRRESVLPSSVSFRQMAIGGAHRNRLSLLAALVAGRKFGLSDALQAAFLHLDDDTPLLRLKGCGSTRSDKVINSSDGRLEKIPADVIGSFIYNFSKAVEAGKLGVVYGICGVKAAQVSFCNAWPVTSLRQELRFPSHSFSLTGSGPGRVLSFDAFSHPYKPYGISEDFMHGKDVGLSLYSRGKPFDNFVTHIGFKGVQLAETRAHYPGIPLSNPQTRRWRSCIPKWKCLVQRMAEVGARERGGKKRG